MLEYIEIPNQKNQPLQYPTCKGKMSELINGSRFMCAKKWDSWKAAMDL